MFKLFKILSHEMTKEECAAKVKEIAEALISPSPKTILRRLLCVVLLSGRKDRIRTICGDI